MTNFTRPKLATGPNRAEELHRRHAEHGESYFQPVSPDAPRSLDDIPLPFRKPAKPPRRFEPEIR